MRPHYPTRLDSTRQPLKCPQLLHCKIPAPILCWHLHTTRPLLCMTIRLCTYHLIGLTPYPLLLVLLWTIIGFVYPLLTHCITLDLPVIFGCLVFFTRWFRLFFVSQCILGFICCRVANKNRFMTYCTCPCTFHTRISFSMGADFEL